MIKVLTRVFALQSWAVPFLCSYRYTFCYEMPAIDGMGDGILRGKRVGA